MKVNGRCLMMLVLIGWLHCLKGGLISGAGCSVSTMAGVLIAGTPIWSSGKNKSGICSSYNSGIHPVVLPIPKY